MSVEMGRATITSGRLLDMKEGDIISLDVDVDDFLVAKVEGVPKYLGRAGVFRGNKAFRVEGFVDRPSEG
jgi:flagellar motor switch protein FliM